MPSHWLEFKKILYFKTKKLSLFLILKGPSTGRHGSIINSREHSNIVFETVEKTMSASQLQSIQRSMNSDASKVKVKGTGIQKAFRNQKAQFSVDTRDAGK